MPLSSSEVYRCAEVGLLALLVELSLLLPPDWRDDVVWDGVRAQVNAEALELDAALDDDPAKTVTTLIGI